MSGNFKKEDLRITKTYIALENSMMTLLRRQKFEKITVNDLCEEALISRVTFYSHFNDKYDLLRFCLSRIKKGVANDASKRGDMNKAINRFIHKNSNIIINLVENANSELLNLFHDFMYSIVSVAVLRNGGDYLSDNQVLLSNFCAGGIVNLLRRQVKTKLSPDTPVVSAYFFKMLEGIVEWDANLSKPQSLEENAHE